MEAGLTGFLRENSGKPVIITTFGTHGAGVLGTIETVHDDIILVRSAGTSNVVCIRRAAIATIEITDSSGQPL